MSVPDSTVRDGWHFLRLSGWQFLRLSVWFMYVESSFNFLDCWVQLDNVDSPCVGSFESVQSNDAP